MQYDFDILNSCCNGDYRISFEDTDELIIQDSAEDFCVYHSTNVGSRKLVRNFYKTIIEDSNQIQKLKQLNERLDTVEE